MLGEWLKSAHYAVGLIATAIPVALWVRRRFREAAVTNRIIREQLLPNGGSSLNDKINTILRSLSAESQARKFSWNCSHIPLYECNLDGSTIWCNEALKHLFGLDESQTSKFGWLAAIDHHERAAVHAKWLNCVNLGIPYEDEYTITNHRSKQRFRCRTTATAATHDGKVVAYFGSIDSIVELPYSKEAPSEGPGPTGPDQHQLPDQP